MAEPNGLSTPKLGYLYHYPRLDHPADNFRLDIFLFSTPTEKHFDVQRVHFFAPTPKGEIERLTVTHPWTFEEIVHVCAGLVEMEDRKGKKENAFSFGGRLEITLQEEISTCSLFSSAPILEISGARPLNALFIDEVEILFAERKAAYMNRHEYAKKLMQADPVDLYRACLESLILKFEHFPHKDDQYFRFLVYLHGLKQSLEATGLTKRTVPTLIDIL